MSSSPPLQYATLASMAFAGIAAGFGIYKLWTSFIVPTPSKSDLLNDKNQQLDAESTYIDPDLLSDDEQRQLHEQFNLACEFMNSKHAKSIKLSNTQKLSFYALFKTATHGPNNTEKPSLLDFQRIAMWNAWSELNGTAKIEAMISYVEAVHKLDSDWRSKVTSVALGQILGENQTMVCDPTKPDSDDDDESDRLFEESRKKSVEQRDRERHELVKEKMVKKEEDKQKKLKEKFSNIAYNNVSVDADVSQGVDNGQESSEMGPVFSSAKGKAEMSDKLAAATITVGDDNTNTSNNNTTTTTTNNDNTNNDNDDVLDKNDNDDGNNKNDEINHTEEQSNHIKQQHAMYNGQIFIRVFEGEFHELVEMNDLTLFQEIIEQQNILAITTQNKNVDIEELKRDQALLFSYKVILVDVNRVTLIHQVAETGTTAQCGILLHTFKYPIDLPNASGTTPLMLAIGNENYDVVRYLVDNGANVLAKSTQDGSSVEDLLDLIDDDEVKTFLIEKIKLEKNKQQQQEEENGEKLQDNNE